MEIIKRVRAAMNELKGPDGESPAGLKVHLGRSELAQIEMEASTAFFFDRAQGNESVCGLPIVRVDADSHFDVAQQ